MPTACARAPAVAAALHDLGEEVLRHLDMDAGAVAGLAVGIDRAAVPDRLQRVDAGLHDAAMRLAIQRGDQTDAAGIVLGGVDARGFKAGLVGEEAPGEGHAALVDAVHGCHSAATASLSLAFALT
jgi:hypothetical protein